MAILITGGAGYIGSHTMVEFLNAGRELVVVDNFVNSKPSALERVKQITGKDFKFYQVDLLDYDALNKKFDAFAEKMGVEFLEANDIKKPRYMEGFAELDKLKDIADRLPEYRAASEHFKKFGIKTYIERLRLSGLAGFEMLQFADCLKYENKNGIVDCFDGDYQIKVMDDNYITVH